METHEQAVKRGKKSRAGGADFERRVRKDLEDKGWIVDKWSNNVELPYHHSGDEGTQCILPGKLSPAKHKFRGKGIPMAMGTGFPDFMAFKNQVALDLYEVIGVEVKSNGYLKPEEKEKCQWLLDNQIFSKILIAKKVKEKNRIKIEYKEWK